MLVTPTLLLAGCERTLNALLARDPAAPGGWPRWRAAACWCVWKSHSWRCCFAITMPDWTCSTATTSMKATWMRWSN